MERLILKQLSINSHCQVTVLRLPGVAGKKRTGIFLSNILDKVKKNEILSYKNFNVSTKTKINLINKISRCSGHLGIAGGQYLDLDSKSKVSNIINLRGYVVH